MLLESGGLHNKFSDVRGPVQLGSTFNRPLERVIKFIQVDRVCPVDKLSETHTHHIVVDAFEERGYAVLPHRPSCPSAHHPIHWPRRHRPSRTVRRKQNASCLEVSRGLSSHGQGLVLVHSAKMDDNGVPEHVEPLGAQVVGWPRAFVWPFSQFLHALLQVLQRKGCVASDRAVEQSGGPVSSPNLPLFARAAPHPTVCFEPPCLPVKIDALEFVVRHR